VSTLKLRVAAKCQQANLRAYGCTFCMNSAGFSWLAALAAAMFCCRRSSSGWSISLLPAAGIKHCNC
jgi:hypothetical protein